MKSPLLRRALSFLFLAAASGAVAQTTTTVNQSGTLAQARITGTAFGGSQLLMRVTFPTPYASPPSVAALEKGWTATAADTTGFTAKYAVFAPVRLGEVASWIASPSKTAISRQGTTTSPFLSVLSTSSNSLALMKSTGEGRIFNGNSAFPRFGVNGVIIQQSNGQVYEHSTPIPRLNGSSNEGQFLSCTPAPDGADMMSFYDATNGDLRFARVKGTAVLPNATIDSTGDVGQYTSIAIVGGFPAISYYDATNGDLKYIRATDANGSSWGAAVTVDNTGGLNVGTHTSLAVVDGRPAIAYRNVTNDHLRFVRANDATGSSWGTPVTVDNSGPTGEFNTLAVIGGVPMICTQGTDYGARACVLWVNSTTPGDGTWSRITISPNNGSGNHSGAGCDMVDYLGQPAISYVEDYTGFLRLATIPALRWVAGTTVSFSTDLVEVEEASGQAVLTVDRSGPVSTSAVTVPLTYSFPTGQAVAADLGSSRPASVTFEAGQTTANITVPIAIDTLAEQTESFTVTLAPTTDSTHAAGSPASTTVRIYDKPTVTTLADDGPGSLRAALAKAAASPNASTITFAPTLSGKTITLGSEIIVSDNSSVTIDASQLPAGLTLDGGAGANRIFEVNSGTGLHLIGLTLTGGGGEGTNDSGNGGAINNRGSLRLTRCTLTGNTSSNLGKAIYTQAGTFVLERCTVSGNPGGSSIYAASGVNSLTFCTLGGGDFIDGPGAWTLTSSIVTGGIYGTGALACVGNNFATVSGPTVTGTTPTGGDPQLAPLALNGGGTMTHSLRGTSPARNNAGQIPTGTHELDQRSKPIIGPADAGAFESQPGGVFSLEFPPDQLGYSTFEGSPAIVTIRRSGDMSGTATVRLYTTAGTATAADFTGRPNTTASDIVFNDGQDLETVPIDTSTDALTNEPAEIFTVTLSESGTTTSLGTPSTASVVIIPTGGTDTIAPGLPTLTTPAPNTVISPGVVGNQWVINIAGRATDNVGVTEVTVQLDGAGPSTKMQLTAPGATATNFTGTIVVPSGPLTKPFAGGHTLTITVKDAANNSRTSAAIPFRLRGRLTVVPSGQGTVAQAGYTIYSFREEGQLITLTAKPSDVNAHFAYWEVGGTTLQQLGLTAAALQLPTLKFTMRHDAVLRPVFYTSAFALLPQLKGEYRGSIAPATPPYDVSNEGAIALTVTNGQGAFTGSLRIDGLVLPVTGAFDIDGHARFGANRTKTLSIARPDKVSFSVSLRWALRTSSFYYGSISGQVTQFLNGESTVTSMVQATLCPASSTSRLDPKWPGLGKYTSHLKYIDPIQQTTSPGLLPTDVPSGLGCGGMDLTSDGKITWVGTLADGTAVTVSTLLDAEIKWHFYSPLYGNQGYIAAPMNAFRTTNSTHTDFDAPVVRWQRPAQDTQHYPAGWPNGVVTEMHTARYTVPSSGSVVPGLRPIDATLGNFRAGWGGGGMSTGLEGWINLSTTDVATPLNSGPFTVTITRTTGLVTGTFPHSNGTRPSYRAFLYQKPDTANPDLGFGFFLTNTPAVKDYSGEAGAVFFYLPSTP